MKYRLVVISTLAIALVACGGGGDSSSGGTGSSAAAGDSVSLTASGSAAPVPAVTNTDLDFVVANPGSTAASNVVLTVALGSGLSNGGVQCSASGGAVCPGDPWTMSVSTLPAGGSLRFTVSAIVAAGATGVITSTGSVSASNDQVTSNNSAEVTITAYSADIQVVGSVSTSDLYSGSIVTYSYTVVNEGPDAARNVVLEQTASSAQTITAITCTAGGGATCPATGVRMDAPSLPSAGMLNFSVITQLSMDALVSVSSTLNATALGDGNTSNNKATVSAKTRIPTSPSSPTFVKLQSDTGDYIGGDYFTLAGRDYSYTGQNAVFEVQAVEGMVSITVRGDEDWYSFFYMPGNQQQLQPGEYVKRLRDLPSPGSGGFNFFGRSNACDQSGWFIVDDVTYAMGELVSLDLRFEQHCDGLEPALRGQIHWVAGDETRPPGPVNPPPAGLWDAAAGVTPASGNYVYITSDPGDFIGQGRTETYTQLDAVFHVRENNGVLTVSIDGNRLYLGSFRAMVPLTRIEPGYYGNTQDVLGGNATVGGLNFTGDGRGCNVLSGWFVIDSISFSDAAVTGVDLRFEQHCEGSTPALRGKIHWRSDDPTQPAGPQVPPPEGLWTPPVGAVPATGNFVYLQSEANDFIGMGLTKSYTPIDSIITVGVGGFTPVGNRFQLTVHGDEEWIGHFQAMNTLADLQPGYYGNLLGFPNHNPTIGGLDWMGEGRGCNVVTGWFVIDSLSYSGSNVDSIELRFEQHCEGRAAALHGYIRWSAADLRIPLPPQNPPPADLWTPPAGATPATGNYFYFESEAGDFIGAGQTRLFTRPDTTFELRTEGNQLSVYIQEHAPWNGYFIPMVPLTQLEVGYYGDLTYKNIAKGLLSWVGDGRWCANAAGWFVVDDVTYVAGTLTAIDVRFEQRCGNSREAALHGKLHWRSDNP